jgi:sulfatase modifying factor 1
VTFAERPADLSDYPGASPEMAQPGSSVFLPPSHFDGATGGAGTPAWWSYVFGADWRRPLGPGSDIRRKMDHPVVHIVAEDAEAYAAWAGKSLPTEAEWEYAARGGLEGRKYAWGDELHPGGRVMAKTWQGLFPYKNDARPGHERTSPVRGFPPNGYGLYDMIGNVWEWTSDWYVDGPPASSPCCGGGRQKASIAPGTRMPRRVLKGGSHLCAPNYCQRYRPAARWPQPIDTSTSHTGFRCVVRG